jgi:NADH-quinone oxidoreductase subunit A
MAVRCSGRPSTAAPPHEVHPVAPRTGIEEVRLTEFVPLLVLLAVAGGLVLAGYAASALLAVRSAMDAAPPFSGGLPQQEHAVSRFHVRWYALTMIFLAFDMEMVFMYPWTLVVAEEGVTAVVEMFVFLGILFAGVTYAWREGALRWT